MPSLIRNLTKDAVVLIPTIYTLEFVIQEENVINSFLCILYLSPAQQLPTTATQHCKQPLPAEHHTHGRHCLSLVPPYDQAFILREIPAGWAEQTSFHLPPFFNRNLARGKAAGFSPSPGTAAITSLRVHTPCS